jgi:hypothetical protein
VRNDVRHFLKTKLKKLLDQCTQEERERFDKWTGGVDGLKDDLIETSVSLIERTLKAKPKMRYEDWASYDCSCHIESPCPRCTDTLSCGGHYELCIDFIEDCSQCEKPGWEPNPT